MSKGRPPSSGGRRRALLAWLVALPGSCRASPEPGQLAHDAVVLAAAGLGKVHAGDHASAGGAVQAHFWQILQEETTMDPDRRDWPDAMFDLLDQNTDQAIDPEELVAATGSLRTPLAEAQAANLFFQMDADYNGVIERSEFTDAARRSQTATESAMITLDDYRDRIKDIAGGMGILMQISRLDMRSLTAFANSDIRKIVVLSLGTAANVDISAVKDLEGNRASVTLADEKPLLGRRLLSETGVDINASSATGGVMTIRACIEVPMDRSPKDILESVKAARPHMAADLNMVPGVVRARGSALGVADLLLSSFENATLGFVLGDADGDKTLSFAEFGRVADRFRRPLTERQVRYCFQGLDVDYSGDLSVHEYLARELKAFIKPPLSVRQISLVEFRKRMMQSFDNPQDAFDAMGSYPADGRAFLRVARSLKPPLTGLQAEYAFGGFDVDQDGLLMNTEFLEVLRYGRLYPTLHELRLMFERANNASDGQNGQHMRTPDGTSSYLAGMLGVLLLLGYAARTASLGLHCSGAAGVVVVAVVAVQLGLVPEDLRAGFGPVHELFEFLITFTAGFALSIGDLRPQLLLTSLLPVLLELLATAAYGAWRLRLPAVESLLLGAALCGVGQDVVAIKAALAARQADGHPLPRLAFLSATSERCLVLVLWGVFSGGAAVGRRHAFVGLTLRALVSIATGALLGYFGGRLLSLRGRCRLLARRVFTGSAAEAAVLALGLGLLGHALACERTLAHLDALGVTGPGRWPLLHPAPLVVALGALLAGTLHADDLEAVDDVLGGIMLIGQTMLFGQFGSESSLSMAPALMDVLPMVACALASRYTGVFITNLLWMHGPRCSCPACLRTNKSTACPDGCFMFLAALPRASLQAFFGTAALAQAALRGSGGKAGLHCLLGATRVYALAFSTAGTLALGLLGPVLLNLGRDASERCAAAFLGERQLSVEGWTVRERVFAGSLGRGPRKFFRVGVITEAGAVADFTYVPAFPAVEAVNLLADALLEDPSALSSLLPKLRGEGSVDAVAGGGPAPPPGYTSVATPSSPSQRQSKIIVRRLAPEPAGLPLAALEAVSEATAAQPVKVSDATPSRSIVRF